MLHTSVKSGQLEIVEPQNWGGAMKGCTGVVNLAGTPISTRWTQEVSLMSDAISV